MVMADQDGEEKHDDPPPQLEMEPFHPLQFYVTFSGIFLIFLLKFVEKSLAKLEFLQRAQKKLIAKRQAKKVQDDESIFVESDIVSSNNSMN